MDNMDNRGNMDNMDNMDDDVEITAPSESVESTRELPSHNSILRREGSLLKEQCSAIDAEIEAVVTLTRVDDGEPVAVCTGDVAVVIRADDTDSDTRAGTQGVNGGGGGSVVESMAVVATDSLLSSAAPAGETTEGESTGGIDSGRCDSTAQPKPLTLKTEASGCVVPPTSHDDTRGNRESAASSASLDSAKSVGWQPSTPQHSTPTTIGATTPRSVRSPYTPPPNRPLPRPPSHSDPAKPASSKYSPRFWQRKALGSSPTGNEPLSHASYSWLLQLPTPPQSTRGPGLAPAVGNGGGLGPQTPLRSAKTRAPRMSRPGSARRHSIQNMFCGIGVKSCFKRSDGGGGGGHTTRHHRSGPLDFSGADDRDDPVPAVSPVVLSPAAVKESEQRS
eukprot:GFYU01009095.1.p1 GENE.GFYU01009095.1~~GFYU01009095.1.p1  ORF type:complete len:402 (-),score=71.94 GFYU01009095.1:222-1397(-)